MTIVVREPEKSPVVYFLRTDHGVYVGVTLYFGERMYTHHYNAFRRRNNEWRHNSRLYKAIRDTSELRVETICVPLELRYEHEQLWIASMRRKYGHSAVLNETPVRGLTVSTLDHLLFLRQEAKKLEDFIGC